MCVCVCVPFLLTTFHLVLWSYLMNDLTTAISHLSTMMRLIFKKNHVPTSYFFQIHKSISTPTHRKKKKKLDVIFSHTRPDLQLRLSPKKRSHVPLLMATIKNAFDSRNGFRPRVFGRTATPYITPGFPDSSWKVGLRNPAKGTALVWGPTAVANPGQCRIRI